MILANITVQLYIVRNPSILGNDWFDQRVNIGFGSIPVVTTLIVFLIEVPYPEFRKQEATYKLLRGWPEEFDAMIIVKTLICSVPFLIFFAFRTYIRIVFCCNLARKNFNAQMHFSPFSYTVLLISFFQNYGSQYLSLKATV